MYIDRIMPFVKDSDFVSSTMERVPIDKIYCPLVGDRDRVYKVRNRKFKMYHVLPCDVYVLGETDNISFDVKNGEYGDTVSANVITVDYSSIARRIEVIGDKASIQLNGAYMVEEGVVTDIFVNTASNGVKVLVEDVKGVSLELKYGSSIMRALSSQLVNEDAAYDEFRKNRSKATFNGKVEEIKRDDIVMRWMDAYFSLPEGEDMKVGDKEQVPLLVGPTGVFKSATVKELCRKYDYRMVDFRVTFAARLDFSGLIKMGNIGDETYSYSCPMEELVTCSDGFREYCRRALVKLEEIVTLGKYPVSKRTEGNSVVEEFKDATEEQIKEINILISKYREYVKTPVLFFDEITRTKDAGVEGILVDLLNQKRFKNMTFKQCKFVAATNANLRSSNQRHNDLMEELDDLYDVNDNLDVAYANRFHPLAVHPEKVSERWYQWADGIKKNRDGSEMVDLSGNKVTNIHPLIIKFLNSSKGKYRGESLVYNMKPVYDAIESGKSDEEKKVQTFPNYRTWEMVSDYIYSIDREYDISTEPDKKKVYRPTIINGLISEWAGGLVGEFLDSQGYVSFASVHGDPDDDVGDFLSSTLDAGVPAMMIGPSSLGKTSRVKSYMKSVEKKTGLKPVMININLASMDTVDVIGMPTKVGLNDYVSGSKIEDRGLGSVGKELKSIISSVRKDHPELGLVDTLTVRAPDMPMAEAFKKAWDEGRDIILFFDECNRVKNTTIMSAMFEAISDQRIFGISFKEHKERVKIVAACNMAHSEMGKNLDDFTDGAMPDYGNAGELDPALAARFSVFWKKNYDEKDVRSFINFLESEKEDGIIDGIILEFMKTLDTSAALRFIASVEKRTLIYAEASTRALNNLSMDLKSMRGIPGSNGFKASLFKGRVIFNDLMVNEYAQVNDEVRSGRNDFGDSVRRVLSLSKKVLSQVKSWDPILAGDTIMFNGSKWTAENVVNLLADESRDLFDMSNRPITDESKKDMEVCIDFILGALDAMRRMDYVVTEERRDILETYVGEEFANEFLPFFNSVFATEDDVEITVEMLSDSDLIDPFLNKFYSRISSLPPYEMVNKVVELMREFWKVHGNVLPDVNYSTMIMGIRKILPSDDSTAEFLHSCSSDPSMDEFFQKAEAVGDWFITDILKIYPSAFGIDDIENMKEAIKNSSNIKRVDVNRSRIL